jgi:hypothetical protein
MSSASSSGGPSRVEIGAILDQMSSCTESSGKSVLFTGRDEEEFLDRELLDEDADALGSRREWVWAGGAAG